MRNMYIGNRLREPGGVTIAGEPIDLGKVESPAYILSTKDDHIAPWQTTYEATQLFSGPTRFVLGNSGHIAGVINPPTKEKYGFRYGEDTPADPDEWFEEATQRPGSWWPDWARWLGGFDGGQVPAREPGSPDYPPIEPAPGSYVKQKIRPAAPGARRRKPNGDARKLNGGSRPAAARTAAPTAAPASATVAAAKRATTQSKPAKAASKPKPTARKAAQPKKKPASRKKTAAAKAPARKKAAAKKKVAAVKKKVAAKKATPRKAAPKKKAATVKKKAATRKQSTTRGR
jgi:hypothetical protein